MSNNRFADLEIDGLPQETASEEPRPKRRKRKRRRPRPVAPPEPTNVVDMSSYASNKLGFDPRTQNGVVRYDNPHRRTSLWVAVVSHTEGALKGKRVISASQAKPTGAEAPTEPSEFTPFGYVDQHGVDLFYRFKADKFYATLADMINNPHQYKSLQAQVEYTTDP